MQSLSNKESDSVATLFSNRVTMLCCDKPPQVSLSESVAAELETSAEHRYRAKLAKSQYQEHDSSSTLPSGQSHTLNASFQPGSTEPVELSLHGGNSDYSSHQVQVEHNQSLDWMSLAAPCFGRITAAYQQNAVVMYPQMMGIVPPRVVLPLDCTQGIPIYVNAKQYHAIIRRRQTRAKLEAQNKAAKSRKPYIHESRHRHALTRARGSGGRFLNTKKGQQSKPATQTSRKNRVQHSESNSWRTSTTSGRDSSCNDDIFQPPGFRVTNSLTIGGSRSRVVAPGDMLLLSIDKCARISTAS